MNEDHPIMCIYLQVFNQGIGIEMMGFTKFGNKELEFHFHGVGNEILISFSDFIAPNKT